MFGMSQENVDLGIILETKVTGDIYVMYLSGYWVMETEAPSRKISNVVVLYYKARQ